MALDGSNQLTVPVEADGPPNHAQHLVGSDSTEQLVELVVGHGIMPLIAVRLLKSLADIRALVDKARAACCNSKELV